MNKKVLRVSIFTIGVLLFVLYIFKWIFTKEYALVIQNDKFIAFGNFVDAHHWLRVVLSVITSFVIYWLFLCASLHKWRLNWRECLYVLGAIILCRVFSYIDVNVSTNLSYVVFPILLILCKADMKYGAIIYSFHIMAQALSLSVRGLLNYLFAVNYITILFLGIESYLWLLLFYFIGQNNKKEG